MFGQDLWGIVLGLFLDIFWRRVRLCKIQFLRFLGRSFRVFVDRLFLDSFFSIQYSSRQYVFQICLEKVDSNLEFPMSFLGPEGF